MKKYDIVATTGSYTDRSGQEKKRYQNVGAVVQGQNGPYIVIEPWFNPAGLEQKNGRVYLSLYNPKSSQGGQSQQPPSQGPHTQQSPPQAQQAAPGAGFNDISEDIPF